MSEIFQRIPCSHLRDPVVICVVVDVISCQSVVSEEDLWRADRIAKDEDKGIDYVSAWKRIRINRLTE